MRFNKKIISILIIYGLFSSIFCWYMGSYANRKTQSKILEEITSSLWIPGYWDLTGTPIEIDDSDPTKNWTYTSSTYEWCTGLGTPENPYIIENVFIDGQYTDICLKILNSNVYFIVRNCTFTNGDSDYYDIYLYYTSHGLIYNNTISRTSGGVSEGMGVYLRYSNYINISNNKFSQNNYGVWLRDYSSNNSVCYNTFKSQFYAGVAISHGSSQNKVQCNSFDNSDSASGFSGINIWRLSNYNLVEDNYFNNYQYTFDIGNDGYYTQYNNFTANIILNAVRGILLRSYNLHNTFTQNIIDGTTEYIVYSGVTQSNNNKFYKNYFLNYAMNPLDAGGSIWDNGLIGNYWDTYAGSDSDGNGIGDSIFSISGAGGKVDHFPIYGDPFYTNTPIHIDGTQATGMTSWQYASTRAWCNGTGTVYDPYTIDNLNIDGQGTQIPLLIENSAVNFVVKNCHITKSRSIELQDPAIQLQNVSNGVVLENLIDFSTNGIYLSNCNNSLITHNQIIDNTKYGIYLYESHFNNITDNSLSNNSHGIRFHISTNNRALKNNLSESDYGFSFQYGHYNYLNENTIEDNDYDGIYVYSSSNNEIAQNIILNNSRYGVYLYDTCSNNLIYKNFIKENDGIGIYIEGSTHANNFFYENSFIANANHSSDDCSTDHWDNGLIGNSWDNYTQLGEFAIDTNDDGLGDNPFMILGMGGCQDNFPIWWDAPILTVNSPNDDALFGFNSPSYSLSVEKGVIHTSWYSFDGGLTNLSLSGLSGTLNQLAWDEIGNGTLSITFCINDSQGYTSSAEITLQKDIIPPVIILNSPIFGEQFTETSPFIDITIYEANLDSIWYTVNFNETIYLLGGNSGSIDSDLWSTLPNGIVTIKIFANDSIDNQGFEIISILKKPGSNTSSQTSVSLSEMLIPLLISASAGAGVVLIINTVVFVIRRKSKR